jgi:DNA-binding IclR family transcriptional regulator
MPLGAFTMAIAALFGAGKMEDADSKTVASVERAVAILEAFTQGHLRLGLAELSEITGLYKSTILRLIQTLEAHSLIAKSPEGSYQLGPKCLQLASVYQKSIEPMEVVIPALRALVASTQESAAFNVINGENRVCVYRIDSPLRIRDHVQLGEIIPLNLGATGHVLRAFSGAPGRVLDAIRAKGFATAIGELTPDTAALAAPVFSAGERLIGAITISGPRSRFGKPALKRIEPLLLSTARNVSEQLGCAPDAAPERLTLVAQSSAG